MTMPRPVVIIPGYYGSELVDTEADNFEVWLTDNSILHPIAVLNAIRLDTGDPERIVAAGPLDHFSLAPFLHIGIYSALRQYLRDTVGYDPQQILAIGVDWRRSLTRLADDLRQHIVDSGAAAVDVITHSHGGLVARAYLQKFADDLRVASLITVGTPHKGMLKTFQAVYEGFRFITFPPDHLRRTARTFPSAYELLPYDPNDVLFTWNGQPDDATAVDAWCETNDMKGMLHDANGVLHGLPADVGVDAAFIYGTRLDTLTRCDGSPTNLNFVTQPLGDSTVPIVSARGDGVTSSKTLRRYPIPYGVHGSLFADDYALELIRGLLTGHPPAPWLAARWSQPKMYSIFSENTLVAEYRDELGNPVDDAEVTLTIDNIRKFPLQMQDAGDYALTMTMPGAGSRILWQVDATAPGMPALSRRGNLVAQNN